MTATSSSKDLQTPIEYLKGIGPQKGELLRTELGIKTFEDLLLHFPFRYVDRSQFHKVRDVQDPNMPVQLRGTIENFQESGPLRRKKLTARFRDDSGVVELVWFRGLKWVKEFIKPGDTYILYGKPNFFKNKCNFVHPEIERYTEKQTNGARLQPVYNATEKLRKKGLDSRGIERLQRNLLNEVGNQVKELLPPDLLAEYKLMPRGEAIHKVHFPGSNEACRQAIRRLKFEELFLIQLQLAREKWKKQTQYPGHVFQKIGDAFNAFYHEKLPFALTNAQKRVIREVREDVGSGVQMNRLLQGDVGSGKTVVALMCMLMAIDNGKQACMMAPTEILAQQHYQTLYSLTQGMGVRVALLTGSTPKSRRSSLLRALKNGSIHILVGTHAIIEEQVAFNDLGFVTVDEQHRFGVAQRGKLWEKNELRPHVLVMTATPIPRTLAMTLYGDLENSVIDELPPGRKPIVTKHYKEKQRLKVFGYLKEVIAKGQQVYVVYPLIEESQTLDYKNLMEGYDVMVRSFPAPDYHIGILHGRMKPEDKEFEMQRFKNGKTQILVSTTVIEVGVDVPNATVMVIENAERFGLSQLHQLRGRIGRGREQSVCILMSGDKLSNDARFRMDTMVNTNNGFEIAEADLKLRGPGDLSGTRQSGALLLKMANLATDQNILQAARSSAIQLMETDPKLEQKQHQMLRRYLQKEQTNHTDWSLIS